MTKLLLFRFSAMGDVALLAPVLQAFVLRYPAVSVTLVTRQKFAVFFEQFPNVRVIGADFDGRHKGFNGLLRLFQELRKLGNFSMVLDVHQNLRSGLLKNLFRLIGVSSVTIDKGRSEKKALTRRNQKVLKPLMHSIERYAQVFEKAGYPLSLSASFRFKVKKSADEELATFLNTKVISATFPWIGIAPFAQHPQKMWPFERFTTLLKQLYITHSPTIFLFGGGSHEIAQLETLRSQFPQAIIVAGKLSLAAELALISRLSLMLCMDSGNMHLAALSGVPVVSIWGATHPYAGFGPWQQGDEAIVQISTDVLHCRPCSVFGNKPCWRGDLACLNEISDKTVAERIHNRLLAP